MLYLYCANLIYLLSSMRDSYVYNKLIDEAINDYPCAMDRKPNKCSTHMLVLWPIVYIVSGRVCGLQYKWLKPQIIMKLELK